MHYKMLIELTNKLKLGLENEKNSANKAYTILYSIEEEDRVSRLLTMLSTSF